MSTLLTNQIPHSVGAGEAFHIDVGLKLELLNKVFGHDEVLRMLNEYKTGGVNAAWLNSFGANLYLFAIGGDIKNPIYSFRICGHHQGEAEDTLNQIAAANDGEYTYYRATLLRRATYKEAH